MRCHVLAQCTRGETVNTTSPPVTRIVSLLPSAIGIARGLGLEDVLGGFSHEGDVPPNLARRL